MLHTTFAGRAVREPEPKTIHDLEAEETAECAYCGAEITPGSRWCSADCREGDLDCDDAADFNEERADQDFGSVEG